MSKRKDEKVAEATEAAVQEAVYETAEQEAEAQDVAVEVADPTPTSGALVYIGPSINSVLRYGTTYVGGLPEVAERAIAKFPPMRKLFVPVDGLLEATKDLNKEKSAMRSIYKQTIKHFTRR